MSPQVVVELGTALICFLGQCYPALVGSTTPTGEFQLEHYTTETPGYGGDILVFKEEADSVIAIHRVLNVPGQQRRQRLESSRASHRTHVTMGCVNVAPEVFEKLIDCCSSSTLTIK
jgi:hypothetical protein